MRLAFCISGAVLSVAAAGSALPSDSPELVQIQSRLSEWLAESGAPTVPAAGPDATLFLSYDPFSEAFALERQEAALGDNTGSRTLADSVTLARPAVTGDGTVALFISPDYDLCMVPTADPPSRQCLGFPGRVYSVAMSKDAKRVALVLQDPETGQPENRITVLELGNGGSRTYPLALPVVDGAEAEAVLYADFMTFNADGSALLYDALSRVKFGGEAAVQCWSVYHLRLDTGVTSIVSPPLKGVDTANPATSNLSNRYVLFEARQASSGASTILVVDLTEGQTGKVVTVPDGFGYPVFTPDDSALLFTGLDSDAITGLSLFRQHLSTDRLQASGEPTLWLRDAQLGVAYRRASADGANALPTVTLKLSSDRVAAPGPVTLTATATDPDGTIARVEFFNRETKLGQSEAAPFVFVWDNVPAGNHLLTARAIDNLGGRSESSPRLLTVSASIPQPNPTRFSIQPGGKNSVRLTIRGQAGEYIISISSDLVEWSDLYPVTLDASGVGAIDDSGGPMNFATMFYRVRRVAD